MCLESCLITKENGEQEGGGDGGVIQNRINSKVTPESRGEHI